MESWLEESYDVKSVREFIPPVKMGKVIKVYDGDTITIATKIYDDPICKFNVRINGVDTAEMKGSSGNAKKMGILAKDKMTELLLGKVVRLEEVSFEKYGRLLAKVYVNDVLVNNWLVENHLAVEYHGDTKQTVNVWDDIYETHWKSYWESSYNDKGKKLI